MQLTIDKVLRQAAALADQERPDDAEKLYRAILRQFPGNAPALAGLRRLRPASGAELPLAEVQRLLAICSENDASAALREAKALSARYPASPLLHGIVGASLTQLGDFEGALGSYDEVLRFLPGDAATHRSRGNCLRQLGRLDEALECYQRVLALSPDSAGAHSDCGNLLSETGQLDEALASYDTALRLQPDFAMAHFHRSLLLRKLKRLDDALAASHAALARSPDFNCYSNHGLILAEMRRPGEALASFEEALKLRPGSAAALNNAGNVLQSLGRLAEAVDHFDAAIGAEPDFADAHGNRGNALEKLGRTEEAVQSYEMVLRLKPERSSVSAMVLYQKALICDWTAPAQDVDLATLGIEGDPVPTFTMLAVDSCPSRQQLRARHWRTKLPPAPPPLPRPQSRPEKLRIGYFSADFHSHAMMFLAVRLFEVHDRSRFEVHGFSLGPDKRDAMSRRAAAGFDSFRRIDDLDDVAAASLARDMGIDIAVDLNGYTRGARSGIFARRAAPIQISYLGYPGTMGADFIDYIIADPTIAPPDLHRFYDEKVINLPYSYQVNDDRRTISSRNFSRSELGLPDAGFVFCCFNNNYKISPLEFDIWMRLLREVPGSVLWLFEGNRSTTDNLRREARARGVDPDRLVFAGRMPIFEHLARHRCADLFLDTFAYNAHTTGSDALWAGLPLVTMIGESFASRVAASLLQAVGLPELITNTAEDYERLALDLARDSPRLRALRMRLADNRLTSPLFDTARTARDIERAYDLVYARRVAGLPPAYIDLAAVAAS